MIVLQKSSGEEAPLRPSVLAIVLDWGLTIRKERYCRQLGLRIWIRTIQCVALNMATLLEKIGHTVLVYGTGRSYPVLNS